MLLLNGLRSVGDRMAYSMAYFPRIGGDQHTARLAEACGTLRSSEVNAWRCLATFVYQQTAKMAASSPLCFQCGGCQRYFDSLCDVTEHQKQCDARAPTAMVAAATEAPPAPVAAGTAPPAPVAAGTAPPAPVAEGTGPGPATMGGKGFFWPINAVLLLIATVGDLKQEFAKGTRKVMKTNTCTHCVY
ncbi:uncharacterized protein LOC123501435 [Portunus trituberculatus]|uniref:uncharacterized protein LOC123501435 n=1 Tax=Portunus trituberculatus TaxID=210409 RepID=UPI001E1CCC0B|nr:uncharacterized protein LOC123501435 [Portunus trituberculatus]